MESLQPNNIEQVFQLNLRPIIHKMWMLWEIVHKYQLSTILEVKVFSVNNVKQNLHFLKFNNFKFQTLPLLSGVSRLLVRLPWPDFCFLPFSDTFVGTTGNLVTDNLLLLFAPLVLFGVFFPDFELELSSMVLLAATKQKTRMGN